MDKNEAIEIITGVREGVGGHRWILDITTYPDWLWGTLPKDLVNRSGEFQFGLEYGYIMALFDAFGISLMDIGVDENDQPDDLIDLETMNTKFSYCSLCKCIFYGCDTWVPTGQSCCEQCARSIKVLKTDALEENE